MCGICGVVYADGKLADAGRLKAANDLIAHRGPDDEGFFVDGPVGLAMRRLAIIDLNTGHQPISYADGRYTIVFNGEIYNYQELREELTRKGHRFATKTDTEAILALYADLGGGCVNKLRGMFAFAIWDKRERRLFLARDRMGKKPLNYAEHAGGLVFGSELRCLFALEPGLSHEVRPEAIDQYLSLQYIPSPGSIYASVKKLPPGHTLTWQDGRLTVERYWDLPVGRKPATTDPEEAKRLIVDKLKEAVRLRMIADVPLGAFLSGGIDSSIVVSLMAELSDRPVKTFCAGFQDEEYSELKYAKAVAQRYGTDHTEFIVEPEMTEVLPKIAWHHGEPFADASALPTYYVSRETRKHVTVALNGDGGDEGFAGYTRYFAMKVARGLGGAPRIVRSALSAAAGRLPESGSPRGLASRIKRFARAASPADLPRLHLQMLDFLQEDAKSELYGDEFRERLAPERGSTERYLAEAYARCEGDDFVNRLLYVDAKTYLAECLMAKMDIATMACSLEARAPMLDHEFVELIYPMPGDWKLKGLRGHKWILKEAFKDRLPPEIRKRGKMGFSIPVSRWFRGPLKGFWSDRVLSPRALARGYFNESVLRRFWDEHQSGRRDHGNRLWALLMLELWHEQCL